MNNVTTDQLLDQLKSIETKYGHDGWFDTETGEGKGINSQVLLLAAGVINTGKISPHIYPQLDGSLVFEWDSLRSEFTVLHNMSFKPDGLVEYFSSTIPDMGNDTWLDLQDPSVEQIVELLRADTQ